MKLTYQQLPGLVKISLQQLLDSSEIDLPAIARISKNKRTATAEF